MNWLLLSLVAGHFLSVFLGTLYLGKRMQPSMTMYMLWLSLLTFLPVIGLLLGWLFLHKDRWYQLPNEKASCPQEPSDYIDIVNGTKNPDEFAQASHRMNTLTADDYLDLLSTTRQLDGKNAVTLLKDAFNSPTESARLLAHSLYSKKEQQLAQQQVNLIERIKQGQGRNPQLHLAFAQLYWHWLELGVLSEVGCQEILTKIHLHADFVLKLLPNSAQAHWLVAQTELRNRHYQAAKDAFKKALAQGHRPELVLPYLQEIAFRQNRPHSHNYAKDLL